MNDPDDLEQFDDDPPTAEAPPKAGPTTWNRTLKCQHPKMAEGSAGLVVCPDCKLTRGLDRRYRIYSSVTSTIYLVDRATNTIIGKQRSADPA